MVVLHCAADGRLSDLVALNLARRGYDVRQAALDAAPDRPHGGDDAIEVVVADLGHPGRLWRDAARVRARFPDVPLVLLGDDWPNRARLRDLEPCAYVRKPFSMGELLAALRTIRPSGTDDRS